MVTAMKTWAAGVIGAVLAVAPAAAQDVDAGTVLATVGGVEITVGHLIVARTTLPPQYQQLDDAVLFQGLLDQLIQQNALAQSVQQPTAATLLTIENQRSGLLAGEALGLVAQAAVTEEALQAAYKLRFTDAEPQTEYNAAHILVPSLEEAQAVKAELDGGADFATVAESRSTGPSGPNGGDLGWFTKGMMVPEFEAAVIALQPGQISEPVQTQFGWHVVVLNETRLKDAPPLEEVRQELAQEIERAAVEARIAEVVAAAQVTRSEVTVDPSVIRNLDLVAQ
jgi:peptidyl-prolyl cis-trans isomerase C